jgi:hypothetical protein
MEQGAGKQACLHIQMSFFQAKSFKKEQEMRRVLFAMLAVVLTLGLFSICLAEVKGGKIDLKVGDEVYACGCGEGCPCQTLSKSPGKCTCGNDMVKTKVTKIEGDKAYITVKGKDIPFAMAGKYACPCGAGCNCDTISQAPGKCACGKDLKKVE